MADIKQWITINGVHIPIMNGSSKEEAIANFLSKNKSKGSKLKKDIDKAITSSNDEQTKEKQIKANQEAGEKLNAKDKANERTQDEHKQAVKELNSSKYEDGTYDIITKKPVEFDDGYQVTFCQIGDNYSNKDYAKKVNECLAMSSDGKTYAGKFESEPEISFHCANREQAIAYAKANNQISIWDWKNCDQILTGGTGRRK